MKAVTGSVPWFIIALDELGLVIPRLYTSNTLPEEIESTAEINRTVRHIPGGGNAAIAFANFGPEKLSLNLETGKYNELTGVSDDVMFFRSLRRPAYNVINEAADFLNASPPFRPPPRVLYWWGVSQLIPSVYFVESIDITTGDFNSIGVPQYLKVKMSLMLDTGNLAYRALRTAERVLLTAQAAGNAAKALGGLLKTGGKPEPNALRTSSFGGINIR